MADRIGFIHLDGFQGATKQRVLIVGETAKKYRIRALTLTKLAGRHRWLPPEQEALVPKYAVRLGDEPSPPSTTVTDSR
jgi:hypothetical protein